MVDEGEDEKKKKKKGSCAYKLDLTPQVPKPYSGTGCHRLLQFYFYYQDSKDPVPAPCVSPSSFDPGRPTKLTINLVGSSFRVGPHVTFLASIEDPQRNLGM